MDFQAASRLSNLMAKNFAEDVFRLLVLYRDISSSEAASRLNLHIKTVQDFLDGLVAFGIVSKKEVCEKKRPYFRYTLIKSTIDMSVDLISLKKTSEGSRPLNAILIKERKKTNCFFKTSPKGDMISSITLYTGKTRSREERKVILTENQGKFLLFLPFPTEAPKSVQDILQKAHIEKAFVDEILDIVDFLTHHNVIEMTFGS